MALLSWEDGLVSIDGLDLPGLLVDQSVDCRVRFDEQSVDGASGKKRTPMGWEDAEVTLTLELLTDEGEEGQDCYDKLEAINAIFRGHDAQANPKIYQIDNRHLQARGVGELIFSQLSSYESDRDDAMMATLSFVENNPPVVKTEMAVAKSAHQGALDLATKLAAQAKVGVPEINPAPEPGLTVDLN